MGIFDFPSTVDLVLRETKQEQINYIGRRTLLKPLKQNLRCDLN